MKDAEVVAVCDANAVKARRAAQAYAVPGVFAQLSEMLETAAPEAVHILTPPQTHKALSIEAMEAGCHVLVEKPMAVDAAEADAMIAAAQRNGVQLGVCHDRLFNPLWIEVQDLVAAGGIGQLVSVEISSGISFKDPRYHQSRWMHEMPGSVFHEDTPHLAYLLMALLGRIRIVAAFARKVREHVPVPADELRVIVDGERGVGSMALSIGATPHRLGLVIQGTRSTLHVNLMTHSLVRLATDAEGKFSKAWVSMNYGWQLVSQTLASTLASVRGRLPSGHRTLIAQFYESLRNGTEPPVSGAEGRKVVGVLEELWAKLPPAGSPEANCRRSEGTA